VYSCVQGVLAKSFKEYSLIASRTRARYPLTLSLLLTMGACSGHSPPPPFKDLPGSYQLSEASARFLQQQKHYAALPASEIRVNRDKTVTVIAMPDVYIDRSGEGSGNFVSGTGRWQVEQFEDDYGLTLEIDPGGSMPPSVYAGNSVLIVGQAPAYQLQVILGDPDTEESLTFERR
jgi:hypothetical protein